MLPTAQGKEFLRYAKSILDQVERMEDLYRSGGEGRLHFSAAVPRASYITHAFARFLGELDQSQQLDINFKETNATDAIHSVAERESKLGIIRYQRIHESYFQKLLEDRSIHCCSLWEFTYQVLFSKNHPLAKAESFTPDDLQNYVEILHGDVTVPSLSVMAGAAAGGSARQKENPDLRTGQPVRFAVPGTGYFYVGVAHAAGSAGSARLSAAKVRCR